MPEQTMSKAINQYCMTVEEMFMAEMFPRPTDYIQPQKSSAWLEKAKQLADRSGRKPVEPFTFRPESCVKLNNIEAARRLLDNMYEQIEADKKARLEKAAREKALREGRPIHDNMADEPAAAPSGSGSAHSANTGVAGRDYPQTRLQIRMASGGQPYTTTLPSDSRTCSRTP